LPLANIHGVDDWGWWVDDDDVVYCHTESLQTGDGAKILASDPKFRSARKHNIAVTTISTCAPVGFLVSKFLL